MAVTCEECCVFRSSLRLHRLKIDNRQLTQREIRLSWLQDTSVIQTRHQRRGPVCGGSKDGKILPNVKCQLTWLLDKWGYTSEGTIVVQWFALSADSKRVAGSLSMSEPCQLELDLILIDADLDFL